MKTWVIKFLDINGNLRQEEEIASTCEEARIMFIHLYPDAQICSVIHK